MEHMDQHALNVPIGGGQTIYLLSQCMDISLKDSHPLGRLIPLTCQLSHLYSDSLNLGVMIPLKLTVTTSLVEVETPNRASPWLKNEALVRV
jgi:hypothetical protein